MRTASSYSREDSWMFTSVASYKFVLARGKSVRLSFSCRRKSLDLRLPTLRIYLHFGVALASLLRRTRHGLYYWRCILLTTRMRNKLRFDTWKLTDHDRSIFIRAWVPSQNHLHMISKDISYHDIHWRGWRARGNACHYDGVSRIFSAKDDVLPKTIYCLLQILYI